MSYEDQGENVTPGAGKPRLIPLPDRIAAYAALSVALVVIIVLALNTGRGSNGVGPTPVSDSTSQSSISWDMPDTEVRAVSLAAVERDLADGHASDASQMLGSIKRLGGFAIDKPHHDVVIYGFTGDGPPLSLDDLVVALRCDRPPGCSIDPSESTLKAIKRLAPCSAGHSVAQNDTLFAELSKIGQQPQRVRVIHVPGDTHFFKVLVDADYQLKRVSNGTDALDIEGFRSITDSIIESSRREFAQGRIGRTPLMMNRFWFTPGKVVFREVPGLAALDQCKLRLLTEYEHVNPQGQISGTGMVESFAQVFAESFTRVYDQIAETQPIYAELRGMFECTALARAMDRADAFSAASLDAPQLRQGYVVGKVNVDRTVAGVADVRRLDLGSGFYVWLFSMGGVDIDITSESVGLLPPASQEERSRLEEFRDLILSTRPDSRAVYWTVKQIPPTPRKIRESLLSRV